MVLIPVNCDTMDEREIAKLKAAFDKASGRLVLLDYDGTLVDFTLVPSTAILPQKVSDLLLLLDSLPGTTIVIITGRGYNDIEILLKSLPVKIIAEHGAMIRNNGIWKKEIDDDGLWKKSVRPIFNEVTQSCSNSYIEEKSFSLTWHYRAAAVDDANLYSERLIGLLNNIIPSLGLKLLNGNKVIEVMKTGVGKGKAVKKLVENMNCDFILSVGDDATDEEMFEYLIPDNNAFTIKAGKGKTYAGHNLAGPDEVYKLLKQLTE